MVRKNALQTLRQMPNVFLPVFVDSCSRPRQNPRENVIVFSSQSISFYCKANSSPTRTPVSAMHQKTTLQRKGTSRRIFCTFSALQIGIFLWVCLGRWSFFLTGLSSIMFCCDLKHYVQQLVDIKH
jgi:hypothetical protein